MNLAFYLASSHAIHLATHPGQFAPGTKPLQAHDVYKVLTSSNHDADALYEYVEDFAFISDPLFDIILSLLSQFNIPK
jgi:hypothetical protein